MKTHFKTFKALVAEIDKREYRNIEGLSAQVSQKDYYAMLEVLPPVYVGDGWLLPECLTGSLYYHFFKHSTLNKYYCVVVDKFKIMIAEQNRLKRAQIAEQTNN